MDVSTHAQGLGWMSARTHAQGLQSGCSVRNAGGHLLTHLLTLFSQRSSWQTTQQKCGVSFSPGSTATPSSSASSSRRPNWWSGADNGRKATHADNKTDDGNVCSVNVCVSTCGSDCGLGWCAWRVEGDSPPTTEHDATERETSGMGAPRVKGGEVDGKWTWRRSFFFRSAVSSQLCQVSSRDGAMRSSPLRALTWSR